MFISAPIHPAGLDALRLRCDLVEVHHPLATEAEIGAALAGCDAVVIRSMPLTAARMDLAPRLKVIAKHGAGMDSIDIEAATKRGIVVANSGDANSFAVAQHAVALILAVQRDVVNVDQVTRAGGFLQRDKFRLRDLWESTVGLVGLGNIGRYAARMVGHGFNARVLAFDPGVSSADMAAIGVEKVDRVVDLMAQADIVSLHPPLLPATRGLIGATELAAMKPEAILVNTSRGEIVDEAALIEVLRAGRIAGAGLDVFDREPPAPDNPLFSLRNVIVSPHIAGGSDVALSKMARAVADAILAVLDHRRPTYFVNPAVAARQALAS